MTAQRIGVALRGAVPWDRLLVALTVLAGLVSLIVILDDTAYPDLPRRRAVFTYLLQVQDIGGVMLVIGIAIGAYLLRARGATLAVVDLLARHPWRVAAVVFCALCAAMFAVVHNHALAGDEHLALFQSRAFAAGHLTGQYPPDLALRLVPPYQWRWLIASETSGAIAAVYWPGFALLLVPFNLVGAPWACNPLLAALSLVMMAKLAVRLTGNPRAGGWAMLFSLASPGFAGMALSYFAMTAQMFFNLLFASLLVVPDRRRLLIAGAVGSFALVLGNPVPHMLFALPWILWIARQPQARGNLFALGAGYAPLAVLLGLGWWLFLRQLQGKVWVLPYSDPADIWERLGNLLWYLYVEFWTVFAQPGDATLTHRLHEQIRLWCWVVPGLPLLALLGWWLGRRVPGLKLLGLSFACTVLGYLFVDFDQGYGWGARYLHPAWSALAILAAAAMVSIGDSSDATRLRSYVLRAALLSLVFAGAFRLWQIHGFMDHQLALRPPFEKGVRQIVFITSNTNHYAQDFVQNDPFLREPVIFMLSRGAKRDYEEVIRRHYPAARLTYQGVNGQVWRLE